MLAKNKKFTTEDFKVIKKEISKKIHTKYGFFLVINTCLPELVGKKGAVLPKKIFKTAVLRNKYKRLFFNTLRELETQKPKLGLTTLLFFPRQVFTKEELVQDLSRLV